MPAVAQIIKILICEAMRLRLGFSKKSEMKAAKLNEKISFRTSPVPELVTTSLLNFLNRKVMLYFSIHSLGNLGFKVLIFY